MSDLNTFKEELEKQIDGLGYQIGNILGELLLKEIRERELKDKMDINDIDVENKGRKKI